MEFKWEVHSELLVEVRQMRFGVLLRQALDAIVGTVG